MSKSSNTIKGKQLESLSRRDFLGKGAIGTAAIYVSAQTVSARTVEAREVKKREHSSEDYREPDDVRSGRHGKSGHHGPSPGERFRDLLSNNLDTNLWPPEALHQEYVDASGVVSTFTAAAPPQIVVPSDGQLYEVARQTFNIRYQRYPAAIFFALNREQVRDAVECAGQLNLRISPAGNRNSFLSMATPDDYIVIDLSHMKSVSLDIDNMIATAGPGVIGPMINSATREKGIENGIEGLTIASGVCGFVGVVPWILGGGFGFLGHRLGAGCDNLVNVEMVLADGSIVNANEHENQDLFWACQGGGGGTFGIVTSMDIKLHELPNEGKIYAFQLVYIGKEDFVRGFDAFQEWFPRASDLWGIDEPRIAPVTTGTPNPFFSFLCYYFGPEEEAIEELKDAGLLFEQFDDDSRVRLDKLGEFPDHQTWYTVTNSTQWMGGAGIPTTPSAIINGLSMNAFGQPYMVQAMQDLDVLQALYGGHDAVNGIPSSPFLGTQVVGGKFYHVNQYVVNRMLDRIPRRTLAKLADFLYELSEESVAGNVVPGLIFAGGHMLGGAYADKAPTETAFFWRDKIMVLFFTFGLPPGYREILDEQEYKLGKHLTNKFMQILSPPKSGKQAAYVNYQQESFPNWQYGYFGDNYKRLQEIKTKYDPDGRFDKQFTVARTSSKPPRRRR